MSTGKCILSKDTILMKLIKIMKLRTETNAKYPRYQKNSS